MQVLRLQYPFTGPLPEEPHVLAIGDFDGLHKGHQQVIRRAALKAAQLSLPAAIMTFDPHPREVLGQAKYASILTPLEDRLKLFAELNVSRVYLVAFDEAFSRLTPEQFVGQVLMRLHVQAVVVGFDFAFGHQGRGNPQLLGELGRGSFAVEVVEPYHLEGSKVSSTAIRERLQRGEVEMVRELLGRHYAICGEIVHGEGRGRTIGIPTANLSLCRHYVVPCGGVYAVSAELDGRWYDGVMNIGTKPTFAAEDAPVALEVHLFDFSESVYGLMMRVEFVAFLRSERRFSSVDELVGQIHADIREAKRIRLQTPTAKS